MNTKYPVLLVKTGDDVREATEQEKESVLNGDPFNDSRWVYVDELLGSGGMIYGYVVEEREENQ